MSAIDGATDSKHALAHNYIYFSYSSIAWCDAAATTDPCGAVAYVQRCSHTNTQHPTPNTDYLSKRRKSACVLLIRISPSLETRLSLALNDGKLAPLPADGWAADPTTLPPPEVRLRACDWLRAPLPAFIPPVPSKGSSSSSEAALSSAAWPEPPEGAASNGKLGRSNSRLTDMLRCDLTACPVCCADKRGISQDSMSWKRQRRSSGASQNRAWNPPCGKAQRIRTSQV